MSVVDCTLPVGVSPVKFADALRTQLEKKGWSVNRLATESGVPYTTLKAYFQAKKAKRDEPPPSSRLPTYASVVAICKALNVSTDVFADCEDLQPQPLKKKGKTE